MKTFKMLVLTDHSTHSVENSLYKLLQALQVHPSCGKLDVASRAVPANKAFFFEGKGVELHATKVHDDFNWYPDGRRFLKGLRQVSLSDYDVVFARLPHPVRSVFWEHLTSVFPEGRIINRPSGVRLTGSKEYLLQFPDLCPPIELCETLEDIKAFSDRFPIVLKPLKNYGGKGLVKIDGSLVWQGHEQISWAAFANAFSAAPASYLAMQYMENVAAGDKRVAVCNGEIVGASLRLPKTGNWLCNASQGGTSVYTTVAPEEVEMAKVIAANLQKKGVVLFGFDTLVNNEGKRILSEINTMSIGGLKQMEEQSGTPVLANVADLLWKYIKSLSYESVSH